MFKHLFCILCFFRTLFITCKFFTSKTYLTLTFHVSTSISSWFLPLWCLTIFSLSCLKSNALVFHKESRFLKSFGGSGRVCLQCKRPGFGPWSGRSPGEGNGNALQYSCLEDPMDGGAWQATVHGVTRVKHDWAVKTRSGEKIVVRTLGLSPQRLSFSPSPRQPEVVRCTFDSDLMSAQPCFLSFSLSLHFFSALFTIFLKWSFLTIE